MMWTNKVEYYVDQPSMRKRDPYGIEFDFIVDAGCGRYVSRS